MNLYSLPALITFTINFSLALIVLMDNPGQTLNRWFAAFIFSFSLWNLSEIIILNNPDSYTALLGAQILYRIIFLFPAFFVIVAHQFPRPVRKWAGNSFFYFAVFSLPLILLIFSFPHFQIQLAPISTEPHIKFYFIKFTSTPLNYALSIISAFYIIWGSLELITKISHLKTIKQKNQTRFFITGIWLIIIVFLLLNVTRNMIFVTINYYAFSTILTFIISFFFFITIARFHLVKRFSFISGGITYAVLSSLFLAVYFMIIRGISGTIESTFQLNSTLFDGFIILLLVFLILPFERRLRAIMDKLINRDIHQYRKNIFTFFQKLQPYLPEKEYFENVEKFLLDNFKCEDVFTFIRSDEEYVVRKNFDPKINIQFPLHCGLTRFLTRKKQALEFYELNSKKIKKSIYAQLEKIETRVLLPLVFEKELMAIIVMKKKNFKLDYSEEELEILSIFTNEIAASLRRNQIIEEVRKRDQQQFQLQKLAALGQLTSGIAHEIRNPLNTISTSAETLLNKKLPTSQERELKNFIWEEANRLNRTLTDFLNLSKIRKPNIEEINVVRLFENLILELQDTDIPDIKISHALNSDNQFILSDHDLLFQILLNLGLNSKAAIKERIKRDADFSDTEKNIFFGFTEKKNEYIFSVTDNGSGIEKEIADSIFDPFFTSRDEGTGLGLSIVHQIVEAMSGSISFSSHQNETDFKIVLQKQSSKKAGKV